MNRKVTIIFALSIAAGCATVSKLKPAPEEISIMQQKVPGITYDKAMKGFNLYKTNCSGCHSLHKPNEYSISGWEKILPEMLHKAKMSNPDEVQLLKDYLFAKSK